VRGDGEIGLTDWLEESYGPSFRTAVMLLGNPADAEDAVQEAFLRVWRFRDSLRNRSDYRPWLYRVVVNSCYSHLRREVPHRDRRISDESLMTLVEPRDVMAHIAVTNDVARAVSALAPDLRTVVLLRYYADLTEREIAIAIGRPAGTVKSRLSEARRQLSSNAAVREHHTFADAQKESQQ
jgi:RNA polymerase sigma-70 factor, ECF subfamily